ERVGGVGRSEILRSALPRWRRGPDLAGAQSGLRSWSVRSRYGTPPCRGRALAGHLEHFCSARESTRSDLLHEHRDHGFSFAFDACALAPAAGGAGCVGTFPFAPPPSPSLTRAPPAPLP